jgi:hypothetical protein
MGKLGVRVGRGRPGKDYKVSENTLKALQNMPKGEDAYSYRDDLDTAEMIRLYETGYTLRQVGEQVGCPGTTVKNRLQTKGINLRPDNSGRKKENLSVEEIVELYASGLTLRKIGMRLGCAATTVRWHLTKAGISLRPSNNISNKAYDIEGMAKAYRNGATLKQVGVLFGCSSTSVGSQLKKAGILLRPSNSVSRKI